MSDTALYTGVLKEEQFLSQVNQYVDDLNKLVTNSNEKINPYTRTQLWEMTEEELSQFYGKRVKKIDNGSGYTKLYAVESEPYYGKSNPINSGTKTVNRGIINQPINTTKSPTTRKTVFSQVAKAGKNFKFFAGAAASAVTAASVGIWLGKTIDSTLYNANPDFWDSIGLSSLNPERWGDITRGDDSLGSGLFNFIFGIDPSTGETQAYIDSDAAAYMAMGLNNAGVFAPSVNVIDSGQTVGGTTFDTDIYFSDVVLDTLYSRANGTYPVYGTWTAQFLTGGGQTLNIDAFGTENKNDYPCRVAIRQAYSPTSTDGLPIFVYMGDGVPNPVRYTGSPSASSTSNFYPWSSATYEDKTVYYSQQTLNVVLSRTQQVLPVEVSPYYQKTEQNISKFAWLLRYGDYTSAQSIDGIGNQEGAVLPNFSGLETLQDYDDYLRSAYPQTYADSVPITYLDENGDEQTTQYIPVPFPNISNYADTQPTSGELTQTSVQQLIDQMTELLQQYTTPTNTANPVNTGEGSPPSIVAPTGSASNLWSIYHPTQAQVDSFGGWLWSPNFIDQIAKIFNNPMESIIGLHKVYATPVDAGNTTIHVGYLDSNVPSAYITQQYVEVDCGTVDLYEQFGNVFDYSPFTDVQLYLPFIGIVPLSVDDVMRSSISITYGVDVITGACLAMVNVERDMYGGVLYQYSGNCAVQYPISSGSYMGIVAGIASIAGGIAATVASGGAAAPALLGAAGGAMSMHTQVQHSGSFSGNAGAMGGKAPYLIISRPITAMYGYEEYIEGYPANSYVSVGDCSGYVKARNVDLVGVTATDTELSEIESLLLNGVYV